MADFALNLPVNAVSFGQVSTCILRELHARKMEPALFPVAGNIDLASQEVSDDFAEWIKVCADKAVCSHSRNTPIFKLWHLNGSFESFSNNQTLLTFYELDKPTPNEINIAKNNHKVLFSSSYTNNVFKEYGLKNTDFVPLCFDKYNFNKTDKKYFNDGRVTFNLVGKFERRKHHQRVIKAWLDKYGDNKKYFLQCAIYNPFLKDEDNAALFKQLTGGKTYFNVNFMGFMPKNTVYNDFLNAGDIVVGMSGGEGWGLPEFHSVALGKHAIILDASAYKDWATPENSVLVSPNGKIESHDGMFFQKGAPFNQGSIFDFNEEEFLNACEEAIKRVEANRVNEAGLKLQQDFSSDKLVDNILSHVG